MLLVRCQNGEFHNVWHSNFASEYTRIHITELKQESNCSLCGHPIYKQVGRLELTGQKLITYKNEVVSLPDTMLVGCDCYGNKLGPVLKIIDKLQYKFNLIEVSLEQDKINLLRLVSELVKYRLRNSCVSPYKIMIPVKYLYCENHKTLASWMTRTQWTRYYPTTKPKKNWSNVVFNAYEKPMAKVRPGTGTNTKETWEYVFLNTEYIIVINSDMIDNLTNEYKKG